MQLDSLVPFRYQKGDNISINLVPFRYLKIGQQRIGEFGYYIRWPASRLARGNKERRQGCAGTGLGTDQGRQSVPK